MKKIPLFEIRNYENYVKGNLVVASFDVFSQDVKTHNLSYNLCESCPGSLSSIVFYDHSLKLVYENTALNRVEI